MTALYMTPTKAALNRLFPWCTKVEPRYPHGTFSHPVHHQPLTKGWETQKVTISHGFLVLHVAICMQEEAQSYRL